MGLFVIAAGVAVFSIAVQYPPGSLRPQMTVIASAAWPLIWLYAAFVSSRWARALSKGDPRALVREGKEPPKLSPEEATRLARLAMRFCVGSGLVIAGTAVWALLALDAFEPSKRWAGAALIAVVWLAVSALLLRPYRARR
jgi:hypothetical protein